MIDTGSATSIIKPSLLREFSEEQLKEPVFYSTINGNNKITHKITTPMPKEFKFLGTVCWKIVELNNKCYDAIMGQNFLVPFKAKINLEHQYIEINNNKIIFDDNKYPFILNEIHTLEGVTANILDNLNFDHLNKEEKNSIIKLLKQNNHLFFKEGDILTATQETVHEIITTTDRPVFSKIYRYPLVHEKEIERQIKEMLEQGIIKESNSPYNSPLWVVPKKKDNSGKQKWRIVIDYRKLNEVTVNDKFPMPNIDGILNKLGRAQYFTTLDLAKGFHQISMKKEDIKKTAFSTNFGHYEYLRMPFGLKNAPSTFQRLMNSVLREFINKICVVYLDDILVFSTSLAEHLVSLNKIFEKLNQVGLKIQIDKCNFFNKETEYLGHVLTSRGIKPNPNKISVIQDLKLPNSTKQIKSFLGITGYYRKFVKDYAKVAQPIVKYLKKNVKINTNDPSYITAFEKLKELITNYPILRYPNIEKRFKLITDASNFALGAVLTQDEHPVCYASRTLNDHEKNYSTIEKELLAIVWGTKYFRPYLFGKEFDLQTDHQPIKWLQSKFSGKDINPRLQRWLIQLGEYDVKIDYIKGKENKIADFLSRINTDTKEINTMYKDDKIDNLDINLENIFYDDFESRENNFSKIKEITKENNKKCEVNVIDESIIINSDVEENLNNKIPLLDTVVNRFRIQIILKEFKNEEYQNIFENKRIFIDKNDLEKDNVSDILRRYIIGQERIGIYSELGDDDYDKLKQIIVKLFEKNVNIKFVKCSQFATDIENIDNLKKQISLYHKNESGHSGIIATYETLKTKIYNPKLKITIHEILNNCDICTGAKYDRRPIREKFHITETPKNINEIVHIDIYTNSKHNFLTSIDKFSKHAICLHLEDRTHITILEKIRQVISIRGKMKKLVFDNEFKSQPIKEFCEKENIEYHLTKPNSHTGNADIERLNGTLTEKIRTLNLEEELPIRTQILKAVEIYNKTYHSTIKTSPLSVQNKEEDYATIYDRIVKSKENSIHKRNENREDYKEHREIGYIKNYKSLRHKEQPKFRKYNLTNIHTSNIKRPLKFSDNDNTDNTTINNRTNNGISRGRKH